MPSPATSSPAPLAPAALSEVARGVWVAHAALYRTTSTVVADDDAAALVIDPGITHHELAGLAAALSARGLRVVAGFSTHAHWDHLLWHPGFGDVPRWARPGTVVVAGAQRTALLAEALEAGADPDREVFGRLTPLPECSDGASLPGIRGGAVVVGHEGHAPGHAALYLPGPRVLVAGDMLSDVEVPLLDTAAPEPLAAYATGLERLASFVAGDLVDVVVPGHGSVADRTEARGRLALDRTYLADLRAGRASADPRLVAGPRWLLTEHRAQVRALGRGGRAR